MNTYSSVTRTNAVSAEADTVSPSLYVHILESDIQGLPVFHCAPAPLTAACDCARRYARSLVAPHFLYAAGLTTCYCQQRVR